MLSLLSVAPIAYIVGGLLPLVLVPYSRAHGEKPGRTGLLVSLIGLAIWSIAYGVAISATAYSTILLLGSLTILGGQLAAIGYLLLAIEHTETGTLTPRLVGALAAVTVGVQVLSLGNPTRLWGETARPVIDTTATEPLATVVVLSTLALAAVAAVLLAVDAVTADGVRRKQSGALVAAGLPIIFITLVDVYVIDEHVYSILPFGVALSAFVIAWALFRIDFLDVVPIARKRIVEEMADAALVVDADDRVVECNSAARQLVGAGPEYAGTSVDQFFGSVLDATDWVRCDGSVDTEITVTADGNRRHFHLQTSRLGDSRTVATGWLIVLRDITPLKRREQALERRESELEFLRQVLTRVLRHNIRNDLTVVRGYASAIADDADRPVATMADEIVETSDELLETSRKARALEQVIGRAESETLDLARIGRSIVEDSRSAYPDATVSFAGLDSCLVDADPLLENALEILLETVLEHDAGSQRTVEVRIERAEDRVIVRLVDRGSGISAAELGVIKRGDETALEGTNGVGPWIVHWIIDRSAASITAETDGDGIQLSISVPTDDTAVDGERRD